MLSKRDFAIQTLAMASQKYNESNTLNEKKESYNLLIKGIKMLLETAKGIFYPIIPNVFF